MTRLSLLSPMPGMGHMMSAREYLMNKFFLDTDERDSIFSIGCKSFLNTAIRCTSYSLPYFSYISSTYFIYLSQYANLSMGAGKTLYSTYLYIQGYRKNDDEKKFLANKMFKEAILHATFAYVDSKVLDYGSYVISPVIKAYISVGILADFLGKSKQLHNKLFSSAIRDDDDFNVADGDGLNLEDKYNYPISPSPQGERRRSSLRRSIERLSGFLSRVRFTGDCRDSLEDPTFFQTNDATPIRSNCTTRRLTRSNAKITPPIPNTSGQTPGKKRLRAEVSKLLEEAEKYQRLAKNQKSNKINTES